MNYRSEKVAVLADKILHHKQVYYEGKSEISDAEYDRLESQLRELAPEHPVLRYVGTEPADDAEKVVHQTPMLSLAKTYKESELESWRKNHKIIGTLKIDGNSLAVVYHAGHLVLAKTRGNGRLGENVTQKAAWVADLVPSIAENFEVEIRGELYCTESQFLQLASELEKLGLDRPTSPRNIVAGLLGRKTHFELSRYFNFFAFEVLVPGGELTFSTEEEKFVWLEDRGFRLPQPKLLASWQAVQDYLAHVKEFMSYEEIGIDGAVFSYNDIALHTELGHTAHHPRYKMSFKWQGQTAQSKILRLQWATSRHGVVTPVAVIEPVELSGATITNVTLHNAAHVKAFNLKAGDRIEIVRSGEVIPKFLQVVEASGGHYDWPKDCSECQSTLEFDDVRLRCPNQDGCPAQQSGTILNWIKSVEIDDLSEKRLGQMLDLGLVVDIPDLYRLKKKDLLLLPQTKDKMATKLFDNIQRSKGVSLGRFLTGLGIAGVGLTSWERLIAVFGSLEGIQSASQSELAAVNGFAEKSAEQIHQGLVLRRGLIQTLLKLGVNPVVPIPTSSGGSLVGKQFAITGALSRPRAEIEGMIKAAGGKVSSSVSKNTFAVVTEEVDSQSSKMQKARTLGIPIWSEQELAEALKALDR